MRLVNEIWDRLLGSSKYENRKLTYLILNPSSFEKLKTEFEDEFESVPERSDLESYFALKIVVEENAEDGFRVE